MKGYLWGDNIERITVKKIGEIIKRGIKERGINREGD
jgi:hypothetical protein